MIRLEGVVRRERGAARPLVGDVSFRVGRGTLAALVGADGAGKTTIMRIAAGILRPQAGTVRIGGRNLYACAAEGAAARAGIGYMPQQFGLYEDLSVLENLQLYADLFDLDGAAREARLAELLAMTDLAAFTARPAGRLSGGMKQKLGLACALLDRPAVLLLDEPGVGVDPLSRRELWEMLLRSVRRDGMTALVATTYMDEASLCDRVIVLEEGRLRIEGSPEALAAAAAGRTCLVRAVPSGGRDGAPAIRLRDLQARLADAEDLVLDAVPSAGGVHVLLEEGVTADGLRDALARGLAGTGGVRFEVDPVPPVLEDGYLVHRARLLGRPPAVRALSGEGVPGAVPDPVIRARDLVRKFGGFTAVDRTSFEVHPGEIFGLLGPNGAGKTTTFRMLCGLIAVTSGSLEVAGRDVLGSAASRAGARRGIGYMSQKFSLYGTLTVEENLEFFAGACGIAGRAARERIGELLERFGLCAVRRTAAGALSGGLRQRLAMAAALINRPALLFLDEPTSGADIPTRRRFWRWMTELSAAGTTIIVTTHFMEEAQYCDRLVIQDAGRTIASGTPEAVRGDSPSMEAAFIRVVQEARRARGTAGERGAA